MTRTLNRQIVVRLSEEEYQRLAADAEANGRTIAQTVRFHLRKLSEVGAAPVGEDGQGKRLPSFATVPASDTVCIICRRELLAGEIAPYCADCEMGQ